MDTQLPGSGAEIRPPRPRQKEMPWIIVNTHRGYEDTVTTCLPPTVYWWTADGGRHWDPSLQWSTLNRILEFQNNKAALQSILWVLEGSAVSGKVAKMMAYKSLTTITQREVQEYSPSGTCSHT